MSAEITVDSTRERPWKFLSGGYSDLVLAACVVAIVAMMILPLSTVAIDVLVAINIALGVGLLLASMYVPSPVAFSSFPSLLLITTLFRLSLAIATTRLILLQADAGYIIATFGKLVVGGNVIVGIVVFVIITIVQYIVVAKGAERVAEVAARFSLDGMPGKQLSIDSDLRSGLIDKDEARQRRKYLEIESQVHGSLDGAMKFVKGDAIAGIVIIVINLLGGLAVGMIQRNLSLAEATHIYSILTVGEGLMMQIPAILSSIAAGLLVTRTAGSEERYRHLGETISRQIMAQPRVLMITGFIALTMMLVPGFPKFIFLLLGSALILTAYALQRGGWRRIWARPEPATDDAALLPAPVGPQQFSAALPLLIEIAQDAQRHFRPGQLDRKLGQIREQLYRDLGTLIPSLRVAFTRELDGGRYRILLFEVPVAAGQIKSGFALVDSSRVEPGGRAIRLIPSERILPEIETSWVAVSEARQLLPAAVLCMDEADLVASHVAAVLRRYASQFIGIQEVNFLLGRMGQDYPELVKETLRVVPLQKVAEVLRRLVDEGISIRNLRDIFEALADAGQREKDIVVLTEYARMGLKPYLSNKYAGPGKTLPALLIHPDLEEKFRQSIRVTTGGSHMALDPQLANQVLNQLRAHRSPPTDGSEPRAVVLTTVDIRRFVRKLIENELYELAVLSYQELAPDVRVQPIAQIRV